MEVSGRCCFMSMRKALAATFAGVLSLVLLPPLRAQLVTVQQMRSDLYVQVSMDLTGEATISAWSLNGREDFSLLPQVLHCQKKAATDRTSENLIHCPGALRKDGLALETVVDLGPIARELSQFPGIELHVNYPRLGFESTSVA